MNESTQIQERRRQRSEIPSEATRLYLEHLTRTLGCEAIALSTEDGLLFNGVGEGYDLDLLGALASLGSQIGTYEPEQRHASAGNALRFYGLDLHGHPIFVSCVGGAPLPLQECAATLSRIHASLRPS
jgi:hypothetical protein